MALAIPHIGARIGKGKSSFKTVLAALALAALVAPLAVSSGFLARNEASLERFTQLNEIATFKNNVAAGYGSGVESDYDLNSATGLAMAIGVGWVYYLLPRRFHGNYAEAVCGCC